MRSRRLALGAALAVMATVAATSSADGAADTVVQLEYRTSEQSGCVSEDELRRMVIEQLGHDPFRPDGDRRVAITLSRTEAGFQGRIAWTDIRGRSLGERTLSSRNRDCREIAANVAFSVALQLQLVNRGAPDEGTAGPTGPSQPSKSTDENHHERGPSDRPLSPAEPPSPSPPPDSGLAAPPKVERPDIDQGARPPAAPREPPPALAGPEPTDKVRLAIGLGPAVGLGMTPGTTAFGRVFVSARLHRFSAELGGDISLPSTLTERDGSGAVVIAVGSSAAGCAHVSALSACLLGRFGWLRARGTDVQLPATSWGRFGEAGLRLAISHELGRATVSLHGDGLVMLSRWNVLLNDTIVWSVPRVGGLIGLDVALRFF